LETLEFIGNARTGQGERNLSAKTAGISMTLRYQSGEEIRRGDRVRFHGEPGRIELVVTESVSPETEWHMREHGGGIQISEPKRFGLTFIPAAQIEEYEDLEFVSRVDGS
jgi:hypothetical protein